MTRIQVLECTGENSALDRRVQRFYPVPHRHRRARRQVQDAADIRRDDRLDATAYLLAMLRLAPRMEVEALRRDTAQVARPKRPQFQQYSAQMLRRRADAVRASSATGRPDS